jgi:putative intracellular protease/amidase
MPPRDHVREKEAPDRREGEHGETMDGRLLTHDGQDATGTATPVRRACRVRIEIVVFDGFDELDAFGPFEVLSMAGFDVELVVAAEPGPVRSRRGVRVDVPGVLGEPDGLIVVTWVCG